MSALMAKSLLYHEEHSSHLESNAKESIQDEDVEVRDDASNTDSEDKTHNDEHLDDEHDKKDIVTLEVCTGGQLYVQSQLEDYSMEGHSKCHVYHCIIHSKGHNTLPNVVGPFFPNPNDPTCKNLYYASMLAILYPWCNLHDIKAGFNSFEMVFILFSEAAAQMDKDILHLFIKQVMTKYPK
ncbi:hypothetical protein BDR04DRAFT_1118679 [Suillus decipiens]|nr:hypothetical protein BDR04DRAFT_1118679 [Suillus decipiens]